MPRTSQRGPDSRRDHFGAHDARHAEPAEHRTETGYNPKDPHTIAPPEPHGPVMTRDQARDDVYAHYTTDLELHGPCTALQHATVEASGILAQEPTAPHDVTSYLHELHNWLSNQPAISADSAQDVLAKLTVCEAHLDVPPQSAVAGALHGLHRAFDAFAESHP